MRFRGANRQLRGSRILSSAYQQVKSKYNEHNYWYVPNPSSLISHSPSPSSAPSTFSTSSHPRFPLFLSLILLMLFIGIHGLLHWSGALGLEIVPSLLVSIAAHQGSITYLPPSLSISGTLLLDGVVNITGNNCIKFSSIFFFYSFFILLSLTVIY